MQRILRCDDKICCDWLACNHTFIWINLLTDQMTLKVVKLQWTRNVARHITLACYMYYTVPL